MMRVLALALALPLGGCLTLQEVDATLDRVNARIERVDEFAHKFCRPAALVSASATAVACAARASGTTPKEMNKAIAFGRAFCANPTSTSPATLAANVGVGVRAILAADAAGCTMQ